MNSALANKIYQIPDAVVSSIREAMTLYPDNPMGMDRANHLVNGKCSYHEMKRLKNFFEYPQKINSKAEYELAGGAAMREWINQTLVHERNSVKGVEGSRQTNDSPVNVGTLKARKNGLTVNLNESTDSDNVAGVAVLVTPINQVLLLKRSENEEWMPGKWGLVGGMIRTGEHPIEGVLREIKEETNLNIKRVIEKFSMKKGNIVEHVFYGIIPIDAKEDVVINEESDNFGIFNIKEIEGLDSVPNLLDYISLVIYNKGYDSIYGKSQLEK